MRIINALIIFPIFRSLRLWLKKVNLLWSNTSLILGKKSNVNGTCFGYSNYIGSRVTISKSTLDDFSYVANDASVANCDIGKYCSIGPNVMIGPGKHPSTNFLSTHPVFYSTAKQCGITFAKKQHFCESERISIGNDVWIGASAIIMDGVTIGDGAIVAAGAIVNKDVESYSIVGGTPARVIRNRFNQNDIVFLMKVKWWDLPKDFIEKNYTSFHEINELKSLLKGDGSLS